ncbi:MAG TPA: LysM peptidoglycan-binding domain-containing protein, partial [Bryobacteraceae bacterium]|nr:LysM peptidoglycan-binding domain-containing protein [Bryobacteraceae bacterium]
LQQLNPALLRAMIPGGLALRVPKGSGAGLNAALEQIPADRRPSWRIHRVQSGETLAEIAREFRSSSSAIATANRLSGSDPNVGDRLLIPAAYHETTPALKTSRFAKSSHRAGKRTMARGGSRARVTQAAAKKPLHRSTATLAEVNRHSHALNR